MMYGIYVYSFQGQFTLPLAFQGVSKFSWQTVGNVLALITGIIAAGLYGNIGISTSAMLLLASRFLRLGCLIQRWLTTKLSRNGSKGRSS